MMLPAKLYSVVFCDMCVVQTTNTGIKPIICHSESYWLYNAYCRNPDKGAAFIRIPATAFIQQIPPITIPCNLYRAHTFWISLFPTKFPNSLFGAKFWIQTQPNCLIVALCVLNDRYMYALIVAFILGCRIVNVAYWVIRLYNAQQYTHMTLVVFSNPIQWVIGYSESN